ncbi:MAG: T9SS type A sorting domain-containing protein [Candidatus Marinimicrobia bacterium]|nr:T9SS type A sorting domain-containing protein [Candidatus Neomarinimicrobiota bacterium]
MKEKRKFSLSAVLVTGLIFMLVTTVVARNKIETRPATRDDIEKLKKREGVYREGVNYNRKINGFGTGLRPPTEEQWEELLQTARVAVSRNITAAPPSSFDNSTFNWFPPVGNQGPEGSCVSWATGYYTKTFQEAYEHNWNLSGCSWQSRGYGGYYGYPTVAYQSYIFSPDFLYHQLNDGVDNGSYYSDNMDLLENIGCCTWTNMPYYQLDANPYDSHCGDSTSWPSETAWREAPLYRSKTGYAWQWVDGISGTLNDLKNILADTNLAIIGIDANKYSSLSSGDLWTTDVYNTTGSNHANTVVGYDDNYGPYTEGGSTKYGAFKVVNQWGTGTWENVSDGFYYISYAVMQNYIQYVFYYDNNKNYNPQRLAVFQMSHNKRGECDVGFGSGTTGSPTMTKRMNESYYFDGGNWPYPGNKIAIDITEFLSTTNYFLSVPDGGSSTTGSITSFSVETYSGTYTIGSPTGSYASTSPPVTTVNGSTVYATVTTFGTNSSPVVSGIPGEIINEDGAFATLALDNYVVDADHSDSQLSWTYSGNTNLTVSISGSRVATITAPADWNGSEPITFTATDPLSASGFQTAIFSANPVNDEPAFTKGANESILENAGPQFVPGWATNMSVGPADEAMYQNFNFNTSNNNNALFAMQPFLSYPSGDLNYEIVPGLTGTVVCTVFAWDDGGVANGGDDTSPTQTFTITVNPVNDPPVFTKGADQTVNEDAGPQTVTSWATGIDPGPFESSQTVTFFVSNNNNGLFVTQPSIHSTTGTLTYQAKPDSNGTATVSVYLKDNGGTANGGNDTSPTQTFTITVNPINDPPGFTKGGDLMLDEDAGLQSIADWATDITAGPGESHQVLTFHTSSDNPALFSTLPGIDGPSGDLVYEIAANTFGAAQVAVYLQDDGGVANGGVDTTTSVTFTITVNPVNDAPSFSKGANQVVFENSGLHTITGWASNISPGPFETTQTVTFVTSNNKNSLFTTQPIISVSGDLSFEVAAHTTGLATVTVYLTDDGGTENGGSNQSSPVTFTITVTDVNDPPSFTMGADQIINEDDGLKIIPAWATDISPGPDEDYQLVTFHTGNDNSTMFLNQPNINSSTGNLLYEIKPNLFGSARVTIYLTDNGGTANGGRDTSPLDTFTITVNPVNDPPSFTKGSNQTVPENSGLQTMAGWATKISAGPNESDQSLTFVTTNDKNGLFSTQPVINAATGTLTFAAKNDSTGTATVTVYLTDNGGTANGGSDQSATQTFTITISPVNDPPSFVKGPDQTLLEDAGAQSVTGWATGISEGPDESGQSLTFHASNNNNALFSTQPSVDAETGNLSFEANADAFGSVTVSLYLKDDGGMVNGGDDTSPTQTFSITVHPVNDPPVFISGADQSVAENSGVHTASAWATGISAGPGESGQLLTFVLVNDDPSLFQTQPAIDATTGNLIFEPAQDSAGTARVTVILSDDGGTSNGGLNQSAPQTFTITISNVNNPPSFSKGPDLTVDEDTPTQIIHSWATEITPGLGEPHQNLVFIVSNDHEPLFSSQPEIDEVSGDLTFATAADSSGIATVTIVLKDDGGSENGGTDQSGPETLTITVNPVNDPPEFTKVLPVDTTIINNAVFNFQYDAMDIEDDALTYFTGSEFDGLAVSSSGWLNWELADDPAVSYDLIVMVTDGYDTTATASVVRVTDVVSITDIMEIPKEFSLGYAYPNPFNPNTKFNYALPEKSDVVLLVYNISGRVVHEAQFRQQEAGYHYYEWNAVDLPSGIYIFQLTTLRNTAVKKCVLLK